ncbi:hypothetical protein K2173_003073 [Erythroxylum novogranatense]|uniref:Uncharacterized protein n=1 Tax=Erythroxylum novogranatense TaxID=1862640 RepID=A0AAV8T9V5_9ROSI|nr:hypothetical protein K2173_003073 [Erythroxylum novogranatense]
MTEMGPTSPSNSHPDPMVVAPRKEGYDPWTQVQRRTRRPPSQTLTQKHDMRGRDKHKDLRDSSHNSIDEEHHREETLNLLTQNQLHQTTTNQLKARNFGPDRTTSKGLARISTQTKNAKKSTHIQTTPRAHFNNSKTILALTTSSKMSEQINSQNVAISIPSHAKLII